jgi:glutathione synthase
MGRRFLFVIDPLTSLNLETETSLLLAQELQGRGHTCFVATLPDLSLSQRGARFRARSIEVDLRAVPPYRVGPVQIIAAGEFSLILMRKDPPVDGAYVAATYILESAARQTPVINDPLALRSLNEKLLALELPAWTPPTLVTSNPADLQQFAAEHGRIVLKPLSDCSGRGIAVVRAEESAKIDAYCAEKPDQVVVAQRFLDGIAAGDKRIIVLEGEAIGAVNRIPKSPQHLANIHQGAKVEATEITARERELVAALRPILEHHRITLAGIDVIDGWLTEVNITSPSAVRQINAMSGTRLEVPIVDVLERLAR